MLGRRSSFPVRNVLALGIPYWVCLYKQKLVFAYLKIFGNWDSRFVISAASAAVVIPKMLEFQNAGLGKEKGIPTIAIASTSIDNVTAMAAFGILHEFIFQKGINKKKPKNFKW